MNKNLLITLITLFSFQSLFAQLPNGSIAPNFELTDLNSVTHKLYEDYTDLNYTVFIDFSAVWCGPCWSYHTSHALKDVYENHGPFGYPGVSPNTTNDVMVFFIEGDGNSETCLGGTGCGTQGDWITGTPYPIICTDPSSGFGNSASISNDWAISGWPTVYQVCPDRTLTVIGQAQNLYSLVSSCLPPPSFNDDARSFMNSSASSGCSSIEPVITIQNYGLNNLTEVTIDVSVNGTLQYSNIFNQIWDNSTNSYQPLNLTTLNMEEVLLTPITGLVNGDVITINVSMPNATIDSDPLNNQVISFAVDLGFNNAYWDGDLSITISGATNVNSWYLKKVSNNLIIASGWGGVSGVVNSFPLEFNECYTLQSINGGGESYTITDGIGQIILQGVVSGPEEFDNFTTGNENWTVGIDDQEISSITVYPSPANDQLYVKGKYDYLRIIDLLGKEVLYSTYVESIDVSKLNNGLYFMEIISSDKRYSQKIQISR